MFSFKKISLPVQKKYLLFYDICGYKNGRQKTIFSPSFGAVVGSGINIPDPQHCFIFLLIFFQECKYLPEHELKQLCDIVCDLLLEESNIQVN